MSRDVPEGWLGIKLGELTHIIGGTTPSKAEPNYWDGGDICWATPTDITSLDTGQYELEKTKSYVTKLGVSKSSLQIIPVGSVLMTSRATIGYAAINSVPMTTNQGFSVFLPNDQFDCRFLLQWIIWKRAELLNVAGGSTFPEISKTTLRSLEIDLPPFHEQRRIAEILSSVDDAIAATQAVIEQTKKVKRATLERLLTKGIGHTHFKQTDIGEIPESWEIGVVEDHFYVQLGKMLSKASKVGSEPSPYLRNANVQWGGIGASDILFMDFTEAEKKKFRLNVGDLLVCEGGEVGRCAIWAENKEMYFQKALHRLREKSGKISNEFLMHYLTYIFKSEVLTAGLIGKNSIPHFTREKFLKLNIPVPKTSEQIAIIKCLAGVDEAIKYGISILESLKSQKSALMSDLLTGRKRVTDTLPLAAE